MENDEKITREPLGGRRTLGRVCWNRGGGGAGEQGEAGEQRRADSEWQTER